MSDVKPRKETTRVTRQDAFRIANWLAAHAGDIVTKKMKRDDFITKCRTETNMPALEWHIIRNIAKDAGITLPKPVKEKKSKSVAKTAYHLAVALRKVIRNQVAIATQLGIILPEPVDEKPITLIIGSGTIPEIPNIQIVP